MKTFQTLFTITCFLLLLIFNSSAQGVGINATETAPDASALLDLSADDKGFLITRADTSNIISPAFGLMTLAPIDSCLYIFSGIEWLGMGGGGSNCSCNCIDSKSTLPKCGDPFIDARDNKSYRTVQVGKQCWMSENLAYLPSVVGPGTGNSIDPYYYVYGYNGTDVTAAKNEVNYSTYGVIYNWPAALDGASPSNTNPSGVQAACPDGWHLPSDEEWKELEVHLGMSQADADALGWRGLNEGTALKSASNWNGNNSSGFTALPGGYRTNHGNFVSGGTFSRWWSSAGSGSNAWSRSLDAIQNGVFRVSYGTENGIYVRCVRD